MIRSGHRAVRTTHCPIGLTQTLKGLRARDLMDQMQVDVEQRGARRVIANQMMIPDLLKRRSPSTHLPLRAGFCHCRIMQPRRFAWASLMPEL